MSDESEHQWYLRGYYEGEEAGRKAEREQVAELADDLAATAKQLGNTEEQWAYEDVALQIRGAEPAAPSATAKEMREAAMREVEAIYGGTPQPEPARPLTLEARAEMLARNVAWESAVETSEATAKIAQLCRAFAREALRVAIVIERPYVDRSDLCVNTTEVTCMMFPENRKPFLSVARDNEAVARDQIIDAAILAAEKGEVPR